MARVLEPEVMESLGEVRAYNELDRIFGEIIFQGFAESALRLGAVTGRALEVGTGPGWISIRLALLNPKLTIEAIDLSANMLELASRNAREYGVGNRIRFSQGDAKAIPFDDKTFDLVLCHNMLHQLANPLLALREIRRVAKPDGAILIRDVRRLPRPLMDIALPLYCLRYNRTLRRLTYDSFRAGFTAREFRQLAQAASIERARIQTYFITHIGLERPALHRTGQPLPPPFLGSFPDRLMRLPYLSNLANQEGSWD